MANMNTSNFDSFKQSLNEIIKAGLKDIETGKATNEKGQQRIAYAVMLWLSNEPTDGGTKEAGGRTYNVDTLDAAGAVFFGGGYSEAWDKDRHLAFTSYTCNELCPIAPLTRDERKDLGAQKAMERDTQRRSYIAAIRRGLEVACLLCKFCAVDHTDFDLKANVFDVAWSVLNYGGISMVTERKGTFKLDGKAPSVLLKSVDSKGDDKVNLFRPTVASLGQHFRETGKAKAKAGGITAISALKFLKDNPLKPGTSYSEELEKLARAVMQDMVLFFESNDKAEKGKTA